MRKNKTPKIYKIPLMLRFVFGGSAGMLATCFVQPLDLIKNRMQLSGIGTTVKEHKSSFHVVRSVMANEGLLGFYNGLSAGLLLQATYTTIRLGVYSALFEFLRRSDGTPPNFAEKSVIGMISGKCGSFFSTPTEISLIRMTVDGRLPPEERRNYKCVSDAMIRIAKEEGISTLFRGAYTTMYKAMLVNAAQLATYSQAKQQLLESKYFDDNTYLYFVASMFSGLATTMVSLPVDTIKTRLQNMKIVDGVRQYKNATDCILVMFQQEGPMAFWKGFTPYIMRIVPHTALTFVFLEEMYSAYERYST